MTDLLVLDESVGPEVATQPVTLFGGLPAVPAGTAFDWPRCGDLCDQPMQYIGKVLDPHAPATAPRLVLLFLCGNPETVGGCETWEPDTGANAAVLVPATAPLRTVPAPQGLGPTTRDTCYGVRVESFPTPERDLDPDFDEVPNDYRDAVLAWRAKHPGEPDRKILGTWGGEPAWLQWPQPVNCPACSAPARLVANLEEGPDHRTDANFGGGRGHLFSRVRAHPAATFRRQR